MTRYLGVLLASLLATAEALAIDMDHPRIQTSIAAMQKKPACLSLFRFENFFTKMTEDVDAHRRELGPAAAAWERAGFVWGMKFDAAKFDAERIAREKLDIVGDPARDSRLVLRVQVDGRTVREVAIAWNPRRYRVAMIADRLPMGRSVVLDPEFLGGLSEKARSELEHRRLAAEMIDARVAEALLADEHPFSKTFFDDPEGTQENIEYLLQIRKMVPSLQGKEPLRDLAVLGAFLGPPQEVLERAFPEIEFHTTVVDGAEVRWIRAKEPTPAADLVPLATSSLLLTLKKNLSMHQRKKVFGMPFASSVAVEGVDRPLYLNFLDIEAMHQLFRKIGRKKAPDTQWFTAHTQLRKYIAGIYGRELGIEGSAMNAIDAFSAENEDRLQYLFLSRNPPVSVKPQPATSAFPGASGWGSGGFVRTGPSRPFEIEGCFGILTVNDESQRFSMEAYAGIRPRYRKGERVAELVRFGMDADVRGFGPKMTFQLSAFLLDAQEFDRVTLITNAKYADELVDRFGFRRVRKVRHESGGVDWVLEIEPEDFAKKSLAKLLDP